ncbi:SNF2-related protein [Shigella sonnei]|uniref:SNF2-related protein n=1 Tax=Shigella sonnei TaxID=624 RepID=UPI0024072F73|nr:SNF2-related protein [Shigella sonnei]
MKKRPTSKQHRNSLLNARHAEPEIPLSLKEHIRLKDHQREGVALLQQLFLRSPGETAGCLLADDMGLGKTLQILSFRYGSLKNSRKNRQISLLLLSLLDNWERELNNFFYTAGIPVLKLYGETIKAVKYPKQAIPAHLQSRGSNLLKPAGKVRQNHPDDLRNASRPGSFLWHASHGPLWCATRHKNKNPAALITHAANAVQAEFKVACTGTPVEKHTCRSVELI